MEEKMELIESLLDKVTAYGKTSFELVKLKAIDKTSDAISSFVPVLVIYMFVGAFMFFLNLGIALWLGELLGNTFYGFFAVAAFYGILGLFIRVFMYKWLKRKIQDSTIKMMLK
jgi:hypothetical protein